MLADSIANDNPQPFGDERRREPRRRVLLQGMIVYPFNSYSADCTIRDLSSGGARIAVPPQAVTDEPFLIVVRDGVAHGSLKVWTNPQSVGLQFKTTHVLRGAAPPSMRAIQAMWVKLDRRHQEEQKRWSDFAPG